MQGSGSGPLGVLLMIAPLAAIPVFAIIGVPQFAPVAASPSDDEDFSDLGASTATSTSTTTAAPRLYKGSADDLFAGVAETTATGRSIPAPSTRSLTPGSPRSARGEPQPSGKWLPPPESLDNWELHPDSIGTASTSGEPKPQGKNQIQQNGIGHAPKATPPDDAGIDLDDFKADLLKPDRPRPTLPGRQGEARKKSSPDERNGGDGSGSGQFDPDTQGIAQLTEQSGWQEAARRLKQLGIRKYRLTSQIDQQNFVFACSFASPNNPQVVRRFEADADNPLEAVQKVLAQIDDWRSRGQSAPPPSEDE
jgi:hypothetical protein